MSETIGSRIRDRQRETRVTNEELASAAGVHVKTVSQWRHDRQRPTDDNLRAIAPLLKTSLDALRAENPFSDAPIRPGNPFGHAAVRESPSDAYLTLPSKVHAHAHRLLAQLAEEGADSHGLDQARRLFLEPERYTYSAHGRVVMMDEADIIKDMDAIAEYVRTMVHERKRLAEDLERPTDE